MSQEFTAKESSNIGAARYSEGARILHIDFKDKAGNVSGTYAYMPGPLGYFTPEDWAKFCAAESKGTHFAKFVRTRKDLMVSKV